MIKTPLQTIGSDWTLEVTVEGSIDPTTQLVINLIDLDKYVEPVVSKLHKKSLTEVFPSEDPSQFLPSQLSRWIFKEIENQLQAENVNLVSVSLSRDNGKDWGSYSQRRDLKGPN